MSSSSLPRWHEVTALFGGRFDPPHLGHREAVRGLFKAPGVKQVLVIPSAAPPHKPASVGAEHRAEMTRLNFQSSPLDSFPLEVQVDLRELDRARLNPGKPSYSFETIQEIKQSIPQIAFVVGADQLSQLSTWYRFPELLSLCHWIVLERKPSGGDTARKTLLDWEASGLASQSALSNTWKLQKKTFLTVVPTDASDLSSTHIRESIGRAGEPPSGSVLAEVLGYLKKHRLYGIQKG